jgi:cell division septation protein DedD
MNTQQNGVTSPQGQIYNEQPNQVVYEDTQESVYSDPTITTSDTIYNTPQTTADNTIITTTDTYPPVSSSQPQTNSQVYTNSSTTYPQSTTQVYGTTSSSYPTYSGASTTNSSSSTYGGYSNSSSSRTYSSEGYSNSPSGGYTTTSNGSYQNGNSRGGYGSSNTSSQTYNYGGYSDPYSSTNNSSSGEYIPIDDPYSTTSSTNRNRYYTDVPYTPSSSSSTYSSSSSYSGSGISGIKLQVAAFKDYAAAEEFKRNLSIPPQYTAYIQRGPINKVIIAGIPTRAKAKELANRQFPGAFIVGGTPTSHSSSHYSSYSSHSSYSSYNSSASNIKSGIGVQVGAFSSKEKAKRVAQEKARGKYTAVVKTAKVRGRTIYKAILLGFKSRAEAKRAIQRGEFGDAFVVTGIYP